MNSSKQRVANVYKYIAMIILSIIIIALTIKAYIYNDADNSSETIILILAISLPIYHLFSNYIKL